MPKIGIITYTNSAITFAKEIAKKTKCELAVKISFPNKQALKIAQRLEKEDKVDGLIASGGIYDHIYTHVHVPMVRMQLTNYEFMKALHEASKLGKRIVYVEFVSVLTNNDIFDPESVESFFGCDVDRITMYRVSEAKKIAGMIVNRQYDVVITPAKCVLDKLPSSVHKVELIYSKELMQATVIRAIHAVKKESQEKEKLRKMQTIVETFEDGMITCDRMGIIETFNAAAEEITGMEALHLIGKNINEFLEDNIIGKIYGNGLDTVDEMIVLDSRKVVISRILIEQGLVIKMQEVTKIQALEREIRKSMLNKGFVAKATFADMAGKSDMMHELKHTAAKYAASQSNILITGESGTGKELLAQSIHNASTFSKGPFIAVNCAALPESLLESELFGYEEGAFTGAKKGGKAGLFELAHNGTVFLDEIGDMPMPLQSRLLRVLQEKEVVRIGGSQVIPVKNRIICATNRNLAQKVEQGLFREDLYYRINILHIDIPPPRQHSEDIPFLARLLFEKKCEALKKKKNIRPNDLQTLKTHHWPGNVRQLETFLERLLVLTDGPDVSHDHFVKCFQHIKGASGAMTLQNRYCPPPLIEGEKILVPLGEMANMEREIIRQVFTMANSDREKIAKTLGISRTTLWRKIKKIKSYMHEL